ncbi:MAG: Calx-beta domain-containing protein [Vicinamibacterales bacterium]
MSAAFAAASQSSIGALGRDADRSAADPRAVGLVTVNFDTVANGTLLTNELAASGVVFDGGFLVSNSTFNAITIPSLPNYVRLGQQVHLLTFVDPANPQVPATTSLVTFTNPALSPVGELNGISIEALDMNGAVITTAVVPSVPPGQGRAASSTTITAAGIHQLRMTNVSNGVNQGVAPFDDLVFSTLTAVPATVSVAATVANAAEGGAAGSVTVTRSGATTVPLSVSIVASGTATAGADYVTLPTTVTIPAGASSTAVAVTPIDDLLVEGPETVSVTVAPGAAYSVGGASTAVVTIADNDVAPSSQPPTSFEVADVTGSRVTMRWEPPAGGLAATGYVLEGGVAPGQPFVALDLPAAPPVLTLDVPRGAFYIRLRTRTTAGLSVPSAELPLIVGVPAAPSTPEALTGVANGTTLGLTWKRTFQGGAPSSYVLDVTGAATASLTVPGAEAFSFAGVPPGVYTFRVRAANDAGASAASNPVTLQFPAGVCLSAPATPTRFLAYRNGGRLGLIWDPAASGGAPSSYVVRVTGPIAGDFPVGLQRLFDVPLPSGAYTFAVLATNACGASSPSAAQAMTLP